MPPLLLHDDEPTLADALERRERVLQVRNMVAGCRTPQVIGVHGDWGAGKTSFLHQLQWELSEDCPQQPEEALAKATYQPVKQDNCTVIWFEAWRHQNETTPVVALLHEIRTQLSLISHTWDKAAKFTAVTLRSSLLAIEDITKKIGIKASVIEKVGKDWENEHLATPLPSHFVRQVLEQEISRIIRRDKYPNNRLVILVDDLDRCQPAAAYALLEGIKIYLNLPSTVFVLGMNQKVVEKAIAGQLTPLQDEPRWIRIKSREYLEKICPNIIHLPLLDDPSKLLADLLAQCEFPHPKPICDIVREHKCLPLNPRQVKTFANLLLRTVERLPDPGDEPERWACLTVVIASLYHFHPEVYRHLVAHGKPFYDELRDWSRGVPQANVHPLIEDLRRSWSVAKPQEDDGGEYTRGAVPRDSYLDKDAFPDPVEGGILRIQRLISELDATEDEIDDFLCF